MIYTAIFGDKDKERKDIHQFKEQLMSSPRMAAKIYKVLPHLFMDEEWSVWIDGNIKLHITEEKLISMVKPYDIGVFIHPERDCIYEEGIFCAKVGKDKIENIQPQLDYYKSKGHPSHGGLGACFIIVRRHTPEINRLNEMWWAHICRFSIRDQLSFPFIYKNVVKYLPKVNMRKNEYFERFKHAK